MLAVANVGLRRFLRERSNIFFVFVLPFLIIFLLGFGFGSVTGSTMGVVGADTSVGAAVLAHLPADQIESYDSRDDVALAVEQNAVEAGAVFPDSALEPIVFISRPGVGLDMRAELEEAIGIENQQIAIVRQAGVVGATQSDINQVTSTIAPTPTETERIGDELWAGLNSFDVSALTQVTLFMFLSALTASSFLIQDRDLGMARRKASTPVPISRLVLGDTLGRFWISTFQAGLIVAVSASLFGVDWGDPLATGLILLLFALVATGAGILLGSAMNNAEAAGGVGVMLGIVLAAIGGAMAPVEIFPPAMQTIAKLTPHFWAIEGLKTSLAGGGVADVGQSAAVLAAIAAGLLAVSVPLYRRTVMTNR